MTKRLFISNLPYTLEIEALESALADVLSVFGKVVSQRLVFEGTTLRSKGLCFVEMSHPSEAQSAISALQGLRVAGYRLRTGEAKPFLCPTKRRKRVEASVPSKKRRTLRPKTTKGQS